MYRKVLLAYDGSIEGRLALREGARLAQLCCADVFLLAVVEISTSTGVMEGGFALPVEDQISTYNKILAEGVERLKAMGFSPTARLGTGVAGQVITEVAHEIEANLVVVGHRQQGPLARWLFGSTDNYLINHLRCSVLVAQTEISDDQFAQLIGRIDCGFDKGENENSSEENRTTPFPALITESACYFSRTAFCHPKSSDSPSVR